jgi:hypothetical protein
MIHARTDYNRIQDPALDDPSLLSPGSTPIAADEPVFLLRASDRLAPVTVEMWATALEMIGGSAVTVGAVRQWANEMRRWQGLHFETIKTPDTPGQCLAWPKHT